jgi:AraC-like DNA-binding protein
MISNSSATFTDISEKLGFSSLNYFSKLFKKKTGMTLTEYSCLASKREAITKKSTK